MNANFIAVNFNNAGTIDLRNGTANNQLTIGGNYVGNNGNLLLQASTANKTSDRLIIQGNASGNTGISVSNLTPGVPFTTSPTLVQVNGTLTPGAFRLTNAQGFGTLQPMLVTSANAVSLGGTTPAAPLEPVATTPVVTTSGRVVTTPAANSTPAVTVAVAAVPNAVALSGPTAAIASRSIATQGSNAILDRVQQLRDTKVAGADIAPAIGTPLAYAPMGYASLISKDPISQNVVQPTAPVDNSVKVATWARATGDLERRTGSSTYSFMGTAATRDLGYSQQTGALLGGVDAVISGLTKADDGLILGLLGGYTTATVNLNNNAGQQAYDGGTVGTYATYLNGPLFVDALFKVDLLGLDIIAPGLRQKTGLTNYSFASNVGYRIPLSAGAYIEPTAGIDYVDTQFNRTSAFTETTVPLRNGDAFRGRIGTRVGSEVIVGNVRFEPSVTTYVYAVLAESNPSGVFNGVTSVTGLRDQGKPRGEVQASLNVFDLSTGISGFVRADMRVGSDLLAGGGRVGVRYTW
ncbi:autotransporter outer membrane beta-barrel domain-containing protein [Methylobacterium longum]|uniref:Autotransporter outer membrane beta-barrel domain-containing protein n=1 Tax=Methylobacterium longum TaxID=767694 RepID=A0ABT8AMR6_9HYPH|nr:autotransporter outer membrane beta-barrel domain-containing protein [Methylobacterium longum]MDN3571127.1 autotransporter outer membrane beta-barrel domain-containing protein [Methylobacterium longum]